MFWAPEYIREYYLKELKERNKTSFMYMWRIPMGDVIKLKHYTDSKDIKHVMYNKQEFEQIYLCETCGDLPVTGGSVWHTKPIEDHPERMFKGPKPTKP